MTSEKMLHSVEVFASFFVPFYFFNAGAHLAAKDFGAAGLLTGVAFLAVALPVKFVLILLHRRVVLREHATRSRRVALSLLPTLVFTLVLAEILRDEFDIAPHIFAGLVIFTVVNTLIPGFVLRVPAADPEVLHAVESSAVVEGAATADNARAPGSFETIARQ
jgi:Kef-type K+ transport system membrane component KefB